MAAKKDLPIFSKQNVNFTPASALTHLCVANNKLVLAMQNKVLMKIDLKNPEDVKKIDLKNFSVDAKLLNMYLDPSGQHLLLAFGPRDNGNPAELFYVPLAHNSLTPKEVPKMKSHIVTSVAWNQSVESSKITSTAPFLLGTSKGFIFEADITNGDFRLCKQVFHIVDSGISGLEYFFLPKSNKCYVLAATTRKLYQFKGFVQNKEESNWFTNLFNVYLSQNSPEEVVEFGQAGVSFGYPRSQSDQPISRLNVLYDTNLAYPKAIGYLTDSEAMMYNNVALKPSAEDNFLTNLVMVDYPKDDNEDSTVMLPSPTPRSLLLTDYHSLFLYKNCTKAICTLNKELIFNETFDEFRGKVLNIVRDPVKGSIWSFTESQVYKYTVSAEDRNIWKIYLDRDDFVLAQEFSRNDPEKLEKISMKQADHFFAKKDYEMSAMYYAMTKATFEEIALKFVQIDDSKALKTFLMKKLSGLRGHDVTKVTTLVFWIIELYLNDLGSLRDFGKRDTAEYNNLDEEFLQFMKQPIVKDCASKNKKAVYDLMASHGDKENLIHFTFVMKDFDEVIDKNIANGQYAAALSTLQEQKNAALYERFIPVLLDRDPKATIDVLIKNGRMLSPIKLLPKFSSKLSADTAKQITRYLEHCVTHLQVNDQSVHDYLVSLYIYFYNTDKLMEYLESQGANSNQVRYDQKYVLMMCLEKKLDLPTIYLYTSMGLYEDAVALAIEVDLELAKRTANVPEDDVEMQKKLWLRIAKHVVKEKNDIQQAMDFLHQCDLLKIEDILPFFPNFVTIDHFKDAICSSLQEYNHHIQNLKEEMEEATRAADSIREDIQAVRNRCAVVRATDRCTLCEIPLLVRNFYVFPCGHQFHADCLMGEVFPTLSHPRKTRLNELQKQLGDVIGNLDVMSTGSAVISARDQIKSDIDDIIAFECVYCGDSMIKLIDVPFIPEDEYERVLNEWK